MKQCRAIKGWTLIETVIVIVLMGIITATAAVLLQHATQSGNQQYKANVIVTQAQNALERMSREIREVRSNKSSELTIGSNSITFVAVDNNTINYSLSGTTLTRNGEPLADNVTNLSFSYFDEGGSVTSVITDVRYVKISMTITKGNNSFTLSTVVFLRGST